MVSLGKICHYLNQGCNETKEGDGHSILSSGLLNLDQQVAVVPSLHPFSTRNNQRVQNFSLPEKGLIFISQFKDQRHTVVFF